MPAKKEVTNDAEGNPIAKKSRKPKAKATDDGKPKVKRAPSSYICFCTAKRQEIKDANPDATFGQLGKILGEIWGQLDAKGKEPYDKISAAKKAALEEA